MFFVISEVERVVLDAGVTRREGGLLMCLGEQGAHLELGPLPFLGSNVKVYLVTFSSWRIAYSVECASKVWILLTLAKVESFAYSGSFEAADNASCLTIHGVVIGHFDLT